MNRELARFSAALIALYAALFAYRWHLFHGPGGYVDPLTGRSQIFSLQPLSTAKALFARVWAILFFPIDWKAPMGMLVEIAILAGCVALIFLALKSPPISRKTLFGLLGCVLVSMIPVLPLALIGEDALGSRYLYLPAIGFCILIGLLVRDLHRRTLRWAATAYAIFVLSVTLHNLTVWRRVAVQADRECMAIAASGSKASAKLPSTLDGVYFFANGLDACVAMNVR